MLSMGILWHFHIMLSTTPQMVRSAARLFLDSLLPPQCLACNAVVAAPGSLCAACFARVTFIAPPHCERCGTPFEGAVIDDLVCGACLREMPTFSRARAAFVYAEDSRALVLKLKHGDRTDAAVHLARWLQRAGAELLSACDVIVPVPLHRWRLLMRTYNQAALLANALGRFANKPVIPDALVRTRATPSQGKFDRKERRRNVARAFAVKRTGAIAGRRILLIDDVLTTGATANACARTLLEAGAREVDVLVLARVAKPL
jgi:ComF family protein